MFWVSQCGLGRGGGEGRNVPVPCTPSSVSLKVYFTFLSLFWFCKCLLRLHIVPDNNPASKYSNCEWKGGRGQKSQNADRTIRITMQPWLVWNLNEIVMNSSACLTVNEVSIPTILLNLTRRLWEKQSKDYVSDRGRWGSEKVGKKYMKELGSSSVLKHWAGQKFIWIFYIGQPNTTHSYFQRKGFLKEKCYWINAL